MIRCDSASASLGGLERYGLDLLLDLARIPRAEPDLDAALTMEVTDPPAVGSDLQAIQSQMVAASGVVRIPRPLLGAAARLAGAVEEQGCPAADPHGRVPSDRNPLVAAGHEREPLVQHAAGRLWEAARRAALGPLWRLPAWPGDRTWAVALTHDLDIVTGWPAVVALRLVELLRHREPRRAGRALTAALAALGSGPVQRSIARLLARLDAAGARTTWFVLCGTPTVHTRMRGDLTYRPEAPAVRGILERIAASGHEIGLHGSFATCTSAQRLGAERTRLGRLIGKEPIGVRQHFLRMRPGPTQRAMRDAGFSYDATYGFPDRNGFRLGMADAVEGWDATAGEASGLVECPLVWMDRAQSKYTGEEDPARWVADALELAEVCRRERGLWVGLWHPNLASALGFPDAEAAFDRLLQGLGQGDPWWASLGEVYDWRQTRRGVRVAAIAPDGRPVIRGGIVATLESGSGERVTPIGAGPG